MKKLFLALGSLTVALAAVAAFSSAAQASTNTSFTIRGNVTSLDNSAKTINVYTTHAEGYGQADLLGSVTTFTTSGAKFYKYDNNMKKVRITLGTVPVQSEVVISGTKKGSHYNVTTLTVNVNTFTFVGTESNWDKTNKTITLGNVTYASYKPGTYQGNSVVIYYGGNTDFRNPSNQQINMDEISGNSENVKVTGTITNGSKFEALKFIDGYPKSK